MIASPENNYLTPEEYLQLEEKSVNKHEYIDGYACAMAGASDVHVTIAGNVFALLRNHLRGKGCRVYISDMKVRIDSINRYYYPDVMVTCDQRDAEHNTFKKHPCLIIEVLSDSTEAFDRGDKFADYQNLETLQEYVLINTKRQRVEVFRRNDEDLWVLQSYTPLQEVLKFHSINFTTQINSIYEDVILKTARN